jgi:hypothetical protein
MIDNSPKRTSVIVASTGKTTAKATNPKTMMSNSIIPRTYTLSSRKGE